MQKVFTDAEGSFTLFAVLLLAVPENYLAIVFWIAVLWQQAWANET